MSEIVKVQRPFAMSENAAHAGMALVYAKGRTNIVQQRLDRATEIAMGDAFKAFFEAEYRQSRGQWSIGRRVADRDW